MHDLLVGYLLDELDDDQRRIVEERLRRDPDFRRQLAHLSRCLGQDRNAENLPTEPPRGLAERTARNIAHATDSGEFRLPNKYGYSSIGFADDDSRGQSHWTVVDMAVATGVVLAVGMLLLPALRDSRSAARRLECQSHLRQLGVALANYSEVYQKYMPRIETGEPAGIFTVRLVDNRFIDRDQARQLIVCPATELAENIQSRQVNIQIPSFAVYQLAKGTVLVRLQKTIGGSFAYRLPFLSKGRYVALRNTYRKDIPILSDAPNPQNPDFKSCNHGGYGQNVLFQDLRVEYLKGPLCNTNRRDHLFLNDDGLPIAGTDRDDSVLGPSDAVLGNLAVR